MGTSIVFSPCCMVSSIEASSGSWSVGPVLVLALVLVPVVDGFAPWQQIVYVVNRSSRRHLRSTSVLGEVLELFVVDASLCDYSEDW